ncbi:MAG: sulfotransferase [Steroidobacteraceae bacterium]
MRLARPFQQLAVRFDAQRLREEVEALPAEAWVRHPDGHPGNSALRLISVEGGENDLVDGPMQATPHLARSPYLRQVLASFGVVWSRSRLLRLAPGANVPAHADINHHWFSRVRVHIPVRTHPQVRFHCGGESVHMAAGEAWIFDNWRLHGVENASPEARIHLVADTSGSAAFWQFVQRGALQGTDVRPVPYEAGREYEPLVERTPPPRVMAPGELELLLLDLRGELAASDDTPASRARLLHYLGMLDALARDWRQLYALHGEDPSGWTEFERLRDSVRDAAGVLGAGIVAATNRVAGNRVLEARVLRACLSLDRVAARRPKRPVFIIAAPRSGSTLLFETLAASRDIATLGGEAHWLIEGIPTLRPGAPGVESNRLSAREATDAVAARIAHDVMANRVDADGRAIGADSALRLLEKTPKNALRIPFIDRIFPDAQFVFLWRDPRANLASIMEAWEAGGWRTYGRLEGFDGPWSMLLPPAWQAMRGRPLEEIAAFQWESANRIALDDLACLPRERWMSLRYEDLVDDPRGTAASLCRFIGIDFDAALEIRVRGALPLSRYTHTAPAADKWRRREREVQSALPSVRATWERLEALEMRNRTAG